MHEVRRYPLGLANDFYVEAPRQYLLPHHPELQFGEAIAYATMDAEAK